MKIYVAILSLVLAVPPVLARQKIDRRFPQKPGKTLSMNLKNMRGRVLVQGWEKNEVLITGKVDGGAHFDDCHLTIRRRTSGIEVTPQCRNFSFSDGIRVNLNIKLPRESNLDITTSANLRLSAVDGQFGIDIAHGNTTLENISGRLTLFAKDGRLDMSACDLEGKMNFTKYKVRGMNSQFSGELTLVNGKLDLARAKEGLDITATNSNVNIHEVHGFVNIEATGSNVDIAGLNGKMTAKMVQGNLIARINSESADTERDVSVEALNGDVTFWLPEGTSTAISVHLEPREDAARQQRIASDFELQKKRPEGGGEIIAGATLNAGRHKMRIHVVHGSVFLRKHPSGP